MLEMSKCWVWIAKEFLLESFVILTVFLWDPLGIEQLKGFVCCWVLQGIGFGIGIGVELGIGIGRYPRESLRIRKNPEES